MQSSVIPRRTILNVSAPAPRTHKLLIGGSHLKMAACFACEYRAPFVDGSDARAADVADEVDDSVVHVHLAEVTEVVRAFEMRGGLPHRLATKQMCHDTPGSGIAMLTIGRIVTYERPLIGEPVARTTWGARAFMWKRFSSGVIHANYRSNTLYIKLLTNRSLIDK